MDELLHQLRTGQLKSLSEVAGSNLTITFPAHPTPQNVGPILLDLHSVMRLLATLMTKPPRRKVPPQKRRRK